MLNLRHVVFGVLVTLTLLSVLPASIDQAETTVTDAWGRMWVGDNQYAVTVGFSQSPLMKRLDAESFIAAMNAGEIENFGYHNWRLASPFELSRLAESEMIQSDLTTLHRYLAVVGNRPSNSAPGSPNYSPPSSPFSFWRGPRPAVNVGDVVYSWPVRYQTGPGEVIVAINSLIINRESSVTGDVITNLKNEPREGESTAPPTLKPGFEAHLEKDVSIDGALKADSVSSDPPQNTFPLPDPVLCNDSQGVLTCSGALSTPVVSLPAFEPPVATGTMDVIVGNNATKTIAPGAYRDISLGRNAKVCFAGGGSGLFELRSIVGGAGSKLLFQGPAKVRIDEQLILGTSAFVGADNGSSGCTGSSESPTPSDVVFHVAGGNVNTGVGTIPAAAAFGAGKPGDPTKLNANFYVFSGAMEVGKLSVLEGAVIAFDFLLGRESIVTRNSAFVFGDPDTPPEAAVVTADPQDVFTNGEENLEIILTGSDPQNENLMFSITDFPNVAVGSIIAGPTAIQDPPLKFCSVTSFQGCDLDADCPGGEFCADTFCTNTSPRLGCTADAQCGTELCDEQVIPPITRASVTYDPVDNSNSFNEFTFQVTSVNGSGSAEVEINPPGDATPDPPAISTVLAIDGESETAEATALTIRLRGKAPCDPAGAPDPAVPCDGVGDDVSLTFKIGEACGLPGADLGDCASPTNGSLSGLTQGAGPVVRTATVIYTPSASAPATDSFKFEACGTIITEVCDKGTVSVSIQKPRTLAENIEVAIHVNQSVTIPLVGNSGGAGGPAPPAPASITRPDYRLAVSPNPGRLRLQTVTGRLVYIGTDPSSDQHGGSADFGTGTCSITTTQSCTEDTGTSGCPAGERCTNFSGLPNAASQLAANAATWAGQSAEPKIACVEGDPIFFGSHVEDLLNSENLFCDSVIAAADLDTTNLNAFDVLYTGATRDNVPDLVAATSNVQDFVDGGGGLVVETNINDAASWTWVPFEALIGHSGSANLGGAAVQNVASHPVTQGLTAPDLADWGITVHSTFVDATTAGFQVLAEGERGIGGPFEPYIIAFDPATPQTPLTFIITGLTAAGTLKDAQGTTITLASLPYTLPDNTVKYVSSGVAAGTQTFNYKVTQGLVSSTAVGTIILSDGCAEAGRPPGCAPTP